MSGSSPLHRLKKLIIGYLLLTGLVANLFIFGGAYWHYRRAAQPLDLYLYDLGKSLEERSPRLAPINRAIHLVFFDSGLLGDPERHYARDIPFKLPPWGGNGANALRADTAPRYDTRGQPISLANRALWQLQSPPTTTPVPVDSVAGLQQAIDRAEPGTVITLAAGVYRLPPDLILKARRGGTAQRPIVLRGIAIDQVILETHTADSLDIDAPYWAISDLVVRGRCSPAPCSAWIHAGAGADALTVRNIFASGLQQLISNQRGADTHRRLADGNTLLGNRVLGEAAGWRLLKNRVIAADYAKGGEGLVQLCPDETNDDICDANNLQGAIDKAKPHTLILLRAGRYRQGARVRTPGLHLIGEPGAVLYKTAVRGKGALVSDANLTVEGLECVGIKVSSGNGACVRQQVGNLTLLGVHFHHAQMGLLTGHNGGNIRIYDSYFHDSGYDQDGQLGHNIYVGSGDFQLIRSWSLNARHEGHEVKSRARVTEIRGAFIASLNARDSRLVDTPNAGLLIIEDSLLAEGPRSSNWQLIGYGLEIRDKQKLPYKDNRLIIRHNTIYSDRAGSSELLGARWAEQTTVEDNVLIGTLGDWPNNVLYSDREEAGVGPYPQYIDLTTP